MNVAAASNERRLFTWRRRFFAVNGRDPDTGAHDRQRQGLQNHTGNFLWLAVLARIRDITQQVTNPAPVQTNFNVARFPRRHRQFRGVSLPAWPA